MKREKRKKDSEERNTNIKRCRDDIDVERIILDDRKSFHEKMQNSLQIATLFKFAKKAKRILAGWTACC
jgi:hypothetical protein